MVISVIDVMTGGVTTLSFFIRGVGWLFWGIRKQMDQVIIQPIDFRRFSVQKSMHIVVTLL